MATQSPQAFRKMALAAPAGILPPTGEILDMFLIVSKEFITAGVHDPSAAEFQAVCPDEPTPELVEAWETAREEACRLSWRPYMHDRSLPHRLGRLKNLPSLIVWGRNDAVVPPSAGEVYNSSIAGSRLVTLENCGHRSDVEKPDELATLLREFFG
jgi:pimeloyl-ACP methyl ester carboxylesterase